MCNSVSAMNPVSVTYVYPLVVLSITLAIAASYSAFSFGERIAASSGVRRTGWLIIGACAMGLGIWSMHYTGMLAVQLPVAVLYHVPTVLLSLGLAVLASAVALSLVSREHMTTRQLLMGALLMGGGIGAMHYTGMAAMRTTAMHVYNYWIVALSILVAVGFSMMALWLTFYFRRDTGQFGWRRIGGAAIMGIGISAMHYTAMAAVTFMSDGMAFSTYATVRVSTLGILAIAGTTVAVLAAALVSSWIGRVLKNERALREAHERLSIAQAAASMGDWHWDIPTGHIQWSAQVENLHCLKPGGFAGNFENWVQTVHPDDRQQLRSTISQAVESGNEFEIEYRIIRKEDSTLRWISGKGKVQRNSAHRAEGVLGVCMDITSRKRTEDALRRTEKLAAAGKLAASIAHEINNPLESVTNLLFLIDSQPCLDEQTKKYLSLAQQELARITQITTQTLGFYRQATRATDVFIGDVVDSVLKLYAGRLHDAHIQVDEQYGEIRPFLGFAGELRQVFMNLVANAADAMRSNGGRLVVRTCESKAWRTGTRGIRITIADTGHGMASDTIQHIFEPFFTTKENTGTGLGLWVTLEIIRKHHGSIRVRSRAYGLNTGTVFSVFLPYAASSSQQPEFSPALDRVASY